MEKNRKSRKGYQKNVHRLLGIGFELLNELEQMLPRSISNLFLELLNRDLLTNGLGHGDGWCECIQQIVANCFKHVFITRWRPQEGQIGTHSKERETDFPMETNNENEG